MFNHRPKEDDGSFFIKKEKKVCISRQFVVPLYLRFELVC